MPGRLYFLPVLAMALSGIASAALAGDAQSAARILDAYERALGSHADIRTLESKSTFFSGRERMSGVRTYWGAEGAWKRVYRRTARGRRIDYFGSDGARLYAGRSRARFWPAERGSRAWYYAMRALARPFALLDFVGNEKAQAGLVVGEAQGHHVLATQPDAHGVRTLYVLDRETGLLSQVRFEAKENEPFATLQYEQYGAVEGVKLPYTIVVELRLEVEDEKDRVWKEQRYSFRERVNEWTPNPRTLPDLAPPAPPADLPGGYRRSIHATLPDPHDLAVADLDRDGKPDIAVCGFGGVAIHFGGAFDKPLRVPLGAGSHRGCRVTDFDLDGVPDLFVMSWTGPADEFFIVDFGKDRAPRIRKLFGAPNQGYSLVIDDFDRDGLPDLVASGQGSRDVSWKFGNGAGGVRVTGTTWKLLVEGKTPLRASGLSTGDVDGDGLREVAVAEPDRPRVVLFRGESNLSFQPRLAFDDKNAGLIRPVDVCLADLDGDGRDDMLIAQDHPLENIEGDLGVLRNTGKGFKVGGYFPVGERLMSIRAADLDGDGNLDAFGPSFLTDQLAILRGRGDGTFDAPQLAGVARGPVRAETGDVDGDGRPDLVVASRLDGAITVLLNANGPPRSPARAPATQVVEPFRAAGVKLGGLSGEYEFAGEWKLPDAIRDPSGIAFLHQDPAATGLVLVSDKTNALYRATVDHTRDRLLVAPAIPLRNAPDKRLDLEGIAFDRQSGTIFLACESDNSVWRTSLFGEFLGRAPTGIPVGDNDGIEGIALRRKRDGTPLLYLFKERMGTSGKKPPVFVFDLAEDPFALEQRGEPLELPAPLVDQTGATVAGQRLLVVGRFARVIAEIPFDGDGFDSKFKSMSYLAVTEKLLGYPGLPKFGMVEAVARAADGDLYLLVDNNGTAIGKSGGTQGRLIRLRCTTPPEARTEPDRVKVRILYIPFEGIENAPAVERSRKDAYALAAKCRREAVEGADWAELKSGYHDARGRVPESFALVLPPREKRAGELGPRDVPPSIARLAFALDVGESDICEYDPKECPWGYYVVQRVE